MDPASKKEGHCDITAHTVLLYVLFCLTYMYCTLYHRHRCIVRTIHVPCFLVLIYLHFVITCSDLTHTLSCIHIQVFTECHSLLLTKHRPYSLSSRCTPSSWCVPRPTAPRRSRTRLATRQQSTDASAKMTRILMTLNMIPTIHGKRP